MTASRKRQMEDRGKTRDQLLREIRKMRRRIAELEGSSPRRRSPQAVLRRAAKVEAAAEYGQPGAPSAKEIPERRSTKEKVLDSPSQWQIAFNSVTDAICLLDDAGGILDCNQSMLKLLGKPSGEVIGKTCWSLMHGTTGPIENCPVSRMRGSLSRESEELAFGERWFDVIAHPVLDEGGGLIGTVHILRDITKRRRAEEALRQSEKKYRGLVEASNSIILRMDKAGIITFCNEFAQHFFGYSEDELVGRNVLGTIVPEVESTGRDLRSMIEDIGSNPSAYINNVNENIRRNGERVWLAWTNRPILDDNGNVLEILCIGNDITERKRTEEELQKLAYIVRHSSELVNLATIDGKMIFLNDAGARALGIDPDEVEQVHISEVLPDHLQGKFRNEILPVLLGPGFWEGDLQARNLKTGKITDVHTMAFTIKDPDTGAPLYLANISRDITETKQAAESLRQSEEKFSKAFQANPSLMLISSVAGGNIIDVNETFMDAIGYERSEIIGRTVNELKVWEPSALADFMDVFRIHGRARDMEMQFRTRGGEMRTASISGEIIQIDGKPCHLLVADDITDQKEMERALLEREKELEAKSLDLQETNTALRVLLKNREEDQREFGADLLANLKELVFPYVGKLKESRLNDVQTTYLKILESNLHEIRAPFLRQLSRVSENLSPVERRIAGLIKEGRQNKEIAEILGVSLNTVATHRYHLRTKLGLKNKNINLVSYLQSLNTL